MHEGPFESGVEDDRPIYVADTRKDGGLRDDWKDAAEYIAHIEGGIALSLRAEAERAGSPRLGHDSLEPGFVMVGKRESLGAIAQATAGIVEHGQAFVAWADMVGDDPEALGLFDHAFLGSWESAAAFASQIIEGLGPLSTDTSEEDRQMRMLFLANELADELQRRGVICAIPNPTAGVWVFRMPGSKQVAATAEDQKGGEDV